MWPTIGAIVVIALTCALGRWQLQRGAEKIERAHKIAELEQRLPIRVGVDELALAAVEFHRVTVRGVWLAEKTVLLDNRPSPRRADQRAGFIVLTPLQIHEAGRSEVRYVLVNRGWLPRNVNDRSKIADFPTSEGEVELEGLALAGAGHVFELGKAMPADRIRQNLDVQIFAKQSGLAVQPFVIQQSTDMSDGLFRDWPQADSGAERHYGYAVQWFALAALTAGLTAFFGLFGKQEEAED